MVKKLWHDPVWSQVIAAAIVALAGAAWVAWIAYRKNWWAAFKHGIVAAWAFLFSTTPVAHWLLGLLMLIAVLFTVLLVGVIVIALQAKNQNPPAPDWQSYTSDSFYGLKWAWTYEGREIHLRGVFCPRCDYQVGPNDTSMFANSVSFHCDSCRRAVPVEGQSWDSLQNVVTRLIQQKLRTGMYPEATSSERGRCMIQWTSLIPIQCVRWKARSMKSYCMNRKNSKKWPTCIDGRITNRFRRGVWADHEMDSPAIHFGNRSVQHRCNSKSDCAVRFRVSATSSDTYWFASPCYKADALSS